MTALRPCESVVRIRLSFQRTGRPTSYPARVKLWSVLSSTLLDQRVVWILLRIRERHWCDYMPVVPLKSSPDLVWGYPRRATRPSGNGTRCDRLGPWSAPPETPRRRSVTVLSGGMGGARFLQGLLHGIEQGRLPGVAADAEVTVIANTADDLWVHGLKVCPDLDTVMYTLGDGIDPERGWGRRDETWSVKTELAAYDVEPTWFGLGDRDIATHLVRTQMLDAGYPLSAGHRGAVPALALACLREQRPAAADDRRPGRDPRRDRRPRSHRAAAGSCTSRSTGSGCAPRSLPRRSSWSGSTSRPRDPA